MKLQQTVANQVEISGQALHSGAAVIMRILPQPENTGIIFGRSDLPNHPRIKANVAAVIDTKKSVTIGQADWKIATIEHLMAVFHGLGVDNALVEVSGEELPRGDGSGFYFAQEIMKAGLETQGETRRYNCIKEPLWVEGTVYKDHVPSKALIVALPSDEFEVSFTFTSDHKTTGTQYFHYRLNEDSFLQQIAPARTIAFRKEIEYLQSQGLALGGDLNSVVIVGDNGYENELRFPEEIVRHKILDILGDLYLAGPLLGHFVAVRSGHTLDLELARKIAGSKIGL